MDMMMIKIYDFELNIGNTLMRSVLVGVFSQLGGVRIMNKASPSFVCGQGRSSRVEDCTIGGEQLLVMQLARGHKKEDLTYLAVMMEIKPNRLLDMLDSLVELLDEHIDVIPTNVNTVLSLCPEKKYQLRYHTECNPRS